MQIKSLVSRVLFLTLALFSLCGCAKTDAGAASVLAGTGLRMSGDMCALASSPAYVQAMGASEELAKVALAMGKGNYTSPRAIYGISFNEKEIFSQLFSDAALSNELRLWMEKRAYASVPTQICGYSGAAVLAAASSLSYAESFVCPELTTPVLYLYQFDGEYSTMVCFAPGRDGAAHATSMFIPNDESLTAAASAEEITAWLGAKTQLPGASTVQISFK